MTRTTNLVANTEEQPSYIAHVNPADILIEENVRVNYTVADLDPTFLTSVKENGVLVPVRGYRRDDGAIIVRMGQRRTIAARAAGLATIPVYVTSVNTLDSEEKAAATRALEQLIENEARETLNDADKLGAYRQMTLGGMSITNITKKTGHKREDIKTLVKIASSPVATAAVVDQQLSFDRALILTEFEGDEEALQRLTAHFYRMEWEATMIRQERANAVKCAEVTAEYHEKNRVTVTDEDEGWCVITDLTDAEADDEIRPVLTEDNHQECPGSAVHIYVYCGGESVQVTEVCTRPNLHHPRRRLTTADSDPYRTPAPGEEWTEEHKAARRELIANNKAWDVAAEIRLTWLTDFMKRRTLPTADINVFIAETLTTFGWMVREDYVHRKALHILEINDETNSEGKFAAFIKAHPTRADRVILALVMSAFEESAERSWWRYPRAESRIYLTHLEKWGYNLTPIERRAAGYTDEPSTVETDEE